MKIYRSISFETGLNDEQLFYSKGTKEMIFMNIFFDGIKQRVVASNIESN